MSSDIGVLIKNRVLLPHPTAKMIRKLQIHVTINFGLYNFFKCLLETKRSYRRMYNIRKQISHFNERVCSKCLILYLEYDIKKCSDCKKNICYNCDQNFYALKCIDCISMCVVCECYVDYLFSCYFCSRKICFSNNRCGLMYSSNNVYYDVCSIRCVPICFLKDEVISSLKILHRKNKLVDNLRMYNLKLRMDSRLCSSYIYFKLNDKWTSEKISQKMCEMKYLFECCDVVSVLRSLNFRSKYKFQIAKQIALKSKGGTYPIVWSWEYDVKRIHKELMSNVLEELSITPSKGYFKGGSEYIERMNVWNAKVKNK